MEFKSELTCWMALINIIWMAPPHPKKKEKSFFKFLWLSSFLFSFWIRPPVTAFVSSFFSLFFPFFIISFFSSFLLIFSPSSIFSCYHFSCFFFFLPSFLFLSCSFSFHHSPLSSLRFMQSFFDLTSFTLPYFVSFIFSSATMEPFSFLFSFFYSLWYHSLPLLHTAFSPDFITHSVLFSLQISGTQALGVWAQIHWKFIGFPPFRVLLRQDPYSKSGFRCALPLFGSETSPFSVLCLLHYGPK